MKEKITQIRRLVGENNIKEALEQILNLVEEDEIHEDLVEEVLILKSTNHNILTNEIEHSQKPEYKALVTEVFGFLKKIKKGNSQNSSTLRQSNNIGQNIKTITPSSDKDGFIKVAYLIPNPIDRDLDCDFNYLRSPFKSYNAVIDCYYLNLETLRNLEGYDYIFIKSEIFKGNIYIEDELLESRLISISHLEDNIIGFKGLVLIAEGDLDIDNISIPFVHIKDTKSQKIKDFLYKCFKKSDLTSLNPDDYIAVNIDNFELIECSKGNSEINEAKSEFPIEMDINSLKSFIGRHEEQVRLVRKVIELNYSGKVLTVKGAGGMGKTTITNKIAMELVLRNYFSDGLGFVACEHSSSYELFEAKIAVCFGMDNITNFSSHIRKFDRFDKLIILDNFETLLNLDTEEEVTKVKILVELICGYASIIITSREIIGFESEEVLILNRLSTDDAFNLFLQNSKRKKLPKIDEKILRQDIIEDLLNNNPLAIKIISSPYVLPSSKGMQELKEELEKDFFSKTSAEIDDVFKDDVDTNIERKRSVYHSINYSYQKLRNSEKLALELLHLFPDGISMNNFKKCFSDKKSVTHIKDRDISALENKSLVELSQGVIKLQSIISRFATHQFNNRDEERKIQYYEDAYGYNTFVMNLALGLRNNNKDELALAICDNNIHNLLYALEYIPHLYLNLDLSEEKLNFLDYIDDLSLYILNEGSIIKYLEAINSLIDSFKEEEHAKLLLLISKIYLVYHHKNFEDSYKDLQILLPFDSISKLDFSNRLVKKLLDGALQIYSYEGHTVECLKLLSKNEKYLNSINLMLFYIGEYDSILSQKYYYHETLLNQNSLNIDELIEYNQAIYYRNHLEKMNSSYTLSKISSLSYDYIDKLVITNPYTKGLKNLMFAFNEKNYEKAIDYYETAIENLSHIKYYHIEAIYFYTKFLKSISNKNYNEQFDKGLELAKKYQYRFLIHQFNNLKDDLDTLYNPNDYPLNVDFDFDDFVKKYSETISGESQEKPIKRQITPKSTTKKLPPITNKPPSKPALYVEGPTDKNALITAFELFAPELIAKVDIISELDEREKLTNIYGKGGGVNWVKKRISGWMENGWKINVGGFFDSDEDGAKAYKFLQNKKAKKEYQTIAKYVQLFNLPNVYGVNHLSDLKDLGIQIPVALEEMFPQKTWKYAKEQGWLEDRKNLDIIIPKSSLYNAKHDGIVNFLSKNNLSDDLYINYQISMKHKEKFMDYLIKQSLEEKTLIFKEFESVVKKMENFYK